MLEDQKTQYRRNIDRKCNVQIPPITTARPGNQSTLSPDEDLQ